MNFDVPEKFEDLNSHFGGDYDQKCRINKKSKALNDSVIIEILKQPVNRLQRGGIFLPEVSIFNTDLLKGIVTSIGPDAKKYNVKVGDLVLYDKLSAFFQPPEKAGTIIITKIENIICVVGE